MNVLVCVCRQHFSPVWSLYNFTVSYEDNLVNLVTFVHHVSEITYWSHASPPYLPPVINRAWALLSHCTLINANHCKLPPGKISVSVFMEEKKILNILFKRRLTLPHTSRSRQNMTGLVGRYEGETINWSYPLFLAADSFPVTDAVYVWSLEQN